MTQLGIAVLLVVVGGIVGICVGWAMRRDDSRSRVEANARYWRGRLADVEAQLAAMAGEPQPAPTAPATTVVHVHMPAYPAAPRYLEVLPALELERGFGS